MHSTHERAVQDVVLYRVRDAAVLPAEPHLHMVCRQVHAVQLMQ